MSPKGRIPSRQTDIAASRQAEFNFLLALNSTLWRPKL